VTIVRPGWWPPGLARLWGQRPGKAAAGYLAGAVLLGFLLMFAWPVLGDAGDAPIVLVLAASWAVAGGACVVQFLRVLPDVAGRKVVEGRVIHLDYIAAQGQGELGGTDVPTEAAKWFMAVDDGQSDVASEHLVGVRVFSHVRKGDIVRLTVGPRHGYVFEVAMVSDSDGKPVAQLGAVPELPGAPIGARELGKAIQRTVRAIDPPEAAAERVEGVRTWTYHLGGGYDYEASRISVHLARGSEGVRAVVGLANRSDDPPAEVKRIGEEAWRYRTLLVARQGELSVGVELPTDRGLRATTYLEEVARMVLRAAPSPPPPTVPPVSSA
jgi:hypothetical protein